MEKYNNKNESFKKKNIMMKKMDFGIKKAGRTITSQNIMYGKNLSI